MRYGWREDHPVSLSFVLYSCLSYTCNIKHHTFCTWSGTPYTTLYPNFGETYSDSCGRYDFKTPRRKICFLLVHVSGTPAFIGSQKGLTVFRSHRTLPRIMDHSIRTSKQSGQKRKQVSSRRRFFEKTRRFEIEHTILVPTVYLSMLVYLNMIYLYTPSLIGTAGETGVEMNRDTSLHRKIIQTLRIKDKRLLNRVGYLTSGRSLSPLG